MTTFTKKADCVRDQLVYHLFRAFPSPTLWFQAGLGLQQSSWVSFLSAGLQIWVTKASKQTHSLWTPFCYFAPLIQVSHDGFLVSAVSLNSALKAFQAGAASPTSFPQPGRMAGWLLHPLGQSPVHSSPNTFFKHISEVIQSQLQDHSSLRSCFPSPCLHVLLKRSVDSI